MAKNPFAHLSLFGRRGRAEEPPPKDEGKKTEDGQTEDEEKAEDGQTEDEKKAEDDETEDEEIEDEEAEDDETAKAAVTKERARWVGVLSAKVAAGNLPLACHLLSATDMSGAGILGALGAAGSGGNKAPKGDRLSLARMDAALQPNVGAFSSSSLDALDAALARVSKPTK